jgi:hypothetical protein
LSTRCKGTASQARWFRPRLESAPTGMRLREDSA